MAGKNELAVIGDFRIANRYEGMDPDLLAEIQDEMGDLDPDNGITCRKIKIPSGGALFYQVEGEDEGDEEPMKEIKGVVLFTHKLNGYWPGSYGGDDSGNRMPTCSSMDGITGLNTNTGEMIECERCPFNQYNTGTDQKGNPTKGKACKNMRRLYLMMNGDPNIYMLTVPPTSIGDVNRQMKKILAGGIPYTAMVVRLSLIKATNSTGTADYSKVKIEKHALLPAEAAAKAREIRTQIKTQYKDFALTLGDYVTVTEADAAPRPAGRAVDVSAEDFEDGPPPHDDADLPF